MHHEIDVVEQDPFGLPVTLDVSRPLPCFLHPFLDFVRDRLDLSRVGPAAYYEIVSKCSRSLCQF